MKSISLKQIVKPTWRPSVVKRPSLTLGSVLFSHPMRMPTLLLIARILLPFLVLVAFSATSTFGQCSTTVAATADVSEKSRVNEVHRTVTYAVTCKDIWL